jgi:Glycosyltransferase family 87
MLLGVAVASTGINEKWDFRSFYAAGYLMRTQPTQLYDLAQQERVQHAIISNDAFVLPFYHPCYELLLIAPFSFLRYSRAYFAFIAFNMLLLLAIFFAARPTFSSIVPVYQPRPGLMLFIYIPVMLTILFGQDSILLLLLVCIAWRQLEFGNDLIAGCLLALALFKFQIVIPMAALIALQRGWRFLGASRCGSRNRLGLCWHHGHKWNRRFRSTAIQRGVCDGQEHQYRGEYWCLSVSHAKYRWFALRNWRAPFALCKSVQRISPPLFFGCIRLVRPSSSPLRLNHCGSHRNSVWPAGEPSPLHLRSDSCDSRCGNSGQPDSSIHPARGVWTANRTSSFLVKLVLPDGDSSVGNAPLHSGHSPKKKTTQARNGPRSLGKRFFLPTPCYLNLVPCSYENGDCHCGGGQRHSAQIEATQSFV